MPDFLQFFSKSVIRFYLFNPHEHNSANVRDFWDSSTNKFCFSNGAQCSPISPTCDEGFECTGSEGGDGYLCCQIPEQKNNVASLIKTRTSSKRPTAKTVATTVSPVPITRLETSAILRISERGNYYTFRELEPRCGQNTLPLLMYGDYLRCPQLGAPCPKVCSVALPLIREWQLLGAHGAAHGAPRSGCLGRERGRSIQHYAPQ